MAIQLIENINSEATLRDETSLACSSDNAEFAANTLFQALRFLCGTGKDPRYSLEAKLLVQRVNTLINGGKANPNCIRRD